MFTRRQFFAAVGLLGLLGGVLFHTEVSASESGIMKVIPLWPGEPPGGGGPTGKSEETAWGSVSHVVTPDFRAFLPQKPNGAGMLVIAGGGFRQISRQGEGYAAAHWLNQQGYAAFVLTYRLPGEGWNEGPRAPLADAERAMRLIRSKAGEFGIEKDRLGVLGFSAGGYLAGLVSVRSDFPAYNAVDDVDRISARPDWTALVYPVISLQAPFTHTSTRRQMLGSQPDAEEAAEWSVNTFVNRKTPPVLLVHAADDPIAKIEHSFIMERQCEAAHVPVQMVELAAGGHGFGMSRPGKASYGWSDHLAAWLKTVDRSKMQVALQADP